MNHSDGGKGSSPRPFSISEDEYAKRWAETFGKNKKIKKCPNCGSESFDTLLSSVNTWHRCCECTHEWDL